jgi:hypothetical protein
MRNYPEYQLCKQIAYYLKTQYPKVIYHFDYAGLNLSIAQAGKMKNIQGIKGFPDLMILEPVGKYHGLFIELKPEGTRLYKKDGEPVNDHIKEQRDCLLNLRMKGYLTAFGIGFENIKNIINTYLQ